MGDSTKNLTIDGERLIKDLKVAELKAELEKRKQSKSGSKKELIERLRSSVWFERTKASSTSVNVEEEVPNSWLQNEANLDNDFIREYFKSQQALYKEQIEVRKNYLGSNKDIKSSREISALECSKYFDKSKGQEEKKKTKKEEDGGRKGRKEDVDHKSKKEEGKKTAKLSVTQCTSPVKDTRVVSPLTLKVKKPCEEAKKASEEILPVQHVLIESRPCRSSARAAAEALTRASLEKFVNSDSDEEEEFVPQRRSRRKSVKGTVQGNETCLPSAGKSELRLEVKTVRSNLDLNEKIPSLKIKLCDTDNTSEVIRGHKSECFKVAESDISRRNNNYSKDSPQNAEVSSSVQDVQEVNVDSDFTNSKSSLEQTQLHCCGGKKI
ncbi:uncharacterized protein LOC143022952 [Oratosquilla oratoria]|uniref:uncharacterized protein LOC143022952 n=1 Tax=Oratosquilla oratoria TaxID=337810 RepID=UPI003F76D05B